MAGAKLDTKVRDALNESRILVLGAQVLLGVQFRAIFEKGFEDLPRFSQALALGSLALMVLSIGLVISPAAFHRIVEKGEDTSPVYLFTSGTMAFALLPFALALGTDFYIVIAKIADWAIGLGIAAAAFLIAIYFWYGLEYFNKYRFRSGGGKMKTQATGTSLSKKIEHVLTEARLVLPGAQALLGFQFITVLMEGFEKLPKSSQWIHLASLCCIALCTIFLMTPAAYHRIVERGEETDRLHRFGTRMVLAAMMPLGLGISGDFFVVARKVTDSIGIAMVMSAGGLIFLYGLWFGLMLFLRRQKGR